MVLACLLGAARDEMSCAYMMLTPTLTPFLSMEAKQRYQEISRRFEDVRIWSDNCVYADSNRLIESVRQCLPWVVSQPASTAVKGNANGGRAKHARHRRRGVEDVWYLDLYD